MDQPAPTLPKSPIGWWTLSDTLPKPGPGPLQTEILQANHPICIVSLNGDMAVGVGGTVTIGERAGGCADSVESIDKGRFPLLAYVPALLPEDLGDPFFRSAFGLKYAYVVGAMANGITSVEMVEAAGRAGILAMFGAAGLSPTEIEAAIDRLRQYPSPIPFGFNLIHSPTNPDLEWATVDLYLRRGVDLVSASAYLDLTLPLVFYRVKGIHEDKQGQVVCPNRVIAKVSRIEVARKFFSPPPPKLLNQLVEQKRITAAEAELARRIPVAEVITAEADSGGHTDNRPAMSMLPIMLALRDEITARHAYPRPLLVGLGGGIATPASTAAAFAMGAAFVLTGTINQACREAGTSDLVRQMLAEARQADVAMAPSADMFEMGVKVQVLKRGTMFPQRATRLYELYRSFTRYEDIPEKQRVILERDFFRRPFHQEWDHTRRYFASRDPAQIARADRDPHHKMALVFRSYLGQSSGWANGGETSRKIDFQIWCGPAMGSFNQWTDGSFLADPRERQIECVAMNLLYGAAVTTRTNWLRTQGIRIPPGVGAFRPLRLAKIMKLLQVPSTVPEADGLLRSVSGGLSA